MSGRQARPTFLSRFSRLETQARNERVRRKGHTQNLQFTINGPVVPGYVTPPVFIGVDADGETPEWKRWTGFAAYGGAGSITYRWWLNGTHFVHPLSGISYGGTLVGPATDGPWDLANAESELTPMDLEHGDYLAVEILGATGDAEDFTATAFIVGAFL